MAVKLSIISKYDATGTKAATAALEKFQKKYKLTNSQMQGTVGTMAAMSVAVQQSGMRIQGYGSKLTSLGNSLTKYVTAPALGAAAALATVALRKGWARLEAIDDAKKKLEGLGHSAESIDSIMQSAQSSVKGTAFGIGDAATVAASTVAAGVAEGEDLTRVLTLIGDSATIAGTDFSSMGAIWNKVAAKGKLSGKEVNQLTQKGIPILQALAEEYGVTASEASKMVSKGEVDFATFADAMENYLGGAAQKSGETFHGVIANIGAAVGRIGANILDGGGGGMFTALKPALFEIKDALSSFEGVAAKWGKVVGEAFATIYERAKALAKAMMPSSFDLSPSADAAERAKRVINKAFDVIEKIARTAKGALDLVPDGLKMWVVFGSPVLSLVGRMTKGVGGLVVSVGKGIASMANFAAAQSAAAAETGIATRAMVAQTAKAKLLGTQAGKLGGLMKNVAVAAAIAAAALLAMGIKAVIDDFKALNKAVNGFEDATTVMQSASSSVQTGMGIATDSVNNYMKACHDAIQAQADLAEDANARYSEAGTEVGKLDYYAQVIQKYGDAGSLTAGQQSELAAAISYVNDATGENYKITDMANGKLSETPAVIDKAIKAKKKQIEAEAALAVYQSMVEQHIQNEIALRQAQTSASEAYTNMMQTEGAEREAWARQYEMATTQVERLTAADGKLQDEMNTALDIYGEYAGAEAKATEQTKKLGDSATAAGGKIAAAGATGAAKIVEKIKAGISSKTGTLNGIGSNVAAAIGQGMGAFSFVSKTAAVASNIINGVKKALGIHSPSREGIAIGENVASAIGLGFESEMRSTSRAASAAVSGFAAGASSAASFDSSGVRSASPVYNVYIDGARVNDDPAIRDALGNMLMELHSIGAMNG